MSIHTSLCTTSGGVALRRSSSSPQVATEVSGGGVRQSGQCFSKHIAASRGERSVPARTRRVRVTHGACTVSRPPCSSTAKLVIVSHSGLGERRTLVRSSVERGIVIMDARPWGNNACSTPPHYLQPPPAFQDVS